MLALGFGLRGLAAGMAAAIAIALCDDLFPRAWYGSALIHLPFHGAIGWWSIPWLATNAALALVIGVRLGLGDRPIGWGEPRVLLTAGLAVAYLLVKQLNPLGLAVFLGLGALVWWLVPRPARRA